MRGTGSRTRSHGRDVSGLENENPRRACVPARRGYIHNHGNLRGRNLFDDFPGGTDHASGSIDLDQYGLIVATGGLGNSARDVFPADGLNCVVHYDLEDLCRRRRGTDGEQYTTDERAYDGCFLHEVSRSETGNWVLNNIVYLFRCAGVDFLRHLLLGGNRRRRFWCSPSRQISTACDQTRAALISQIGPRPLDENQQPIAKANQE